MRPRIICHMASSIDGRILPERWSPGDAHSHAAYEHIHERLGGGSWLVGRVTGAEFAKRSGYPQDADATFPREDWLPTKGAGAYAIVADAHGRIAWGRSDVGGDPIVALLTQGVSDAHLAGLRADGVGYVFAGEDELDLEAALEAVADGLGVERLLLEGGGHINGALLRAGLVDEISLMIVPAIDGTGGAPSTFDGPIGETATLPIDRIRLLEHELLEAGIVWLRYEVVASEDAGLMSSRR